VPDPATNRPMDIIVGRDLYKETPDILFSADLSFKSRAANIAEKDDALGMLTKGVPPALATLILKPQIFSQAVRQCLLARGMHDLAALVLSDQEIEQKIQQQAQAAAMMPPGGPGAAAPGGPKPPGPPMPTPSVPTGAPQRTPGTVPPQSRTEPGVPSQAAPGGAQ
jgi:hypothetical protein